MRPGSRLREHDRSSSPSSFAPHTHPPLLRMTARATASSGSASAVILSMRGCAGGAQTRFRRTMLDAPRFPAERTRSFVVAEFLRPPHPPALAQDDSKGNGKLGFCFCCHPEHAWVCGRGSNSLSTHDVGCAQVPG